MSNKFPKVCLNFIILRNNKLLLGLLTKNWMFQGKQVYGTPGRDLQFQETIGNSVKRDIKEELDVEVISHKVFSVNANYEYGNHYIDIGVVVEIKGEIKLLKPDDWEKWKWFGLNEIPDNLFPTAKNLIKCYLENKVCVVE